MCVYGVLEPWRSPGRERGFVGALPSLESWVSVFAMFTGGIAVVRTAAVPKVVRESLGDSVEEYVRRLPLSMVIAVFRPRALL